MIAELERRTRDELGPDATHLDYAVHWVESGGTILALAEEIGVRRQALSGYLHRTFSDALERLERARPSCAHAMVEQAVQLIDDADTSSREELAHAKMRADVRTWLASRLHREAYGDAKGATVSISIGSMHLGAIKELAQATATLAAGHQAEEIVQLGDGT
jgi:hypothetical protein